MPSRIIREDWLDSETVNKLDASEERFLLRLCLRADDFGRFHANTLLLKSSLFPLAEAVRSTDIARWLAACERSGVVRCYEAHGKRYVEIQKFRQRTRAEQSKFPDPPSNDGQMTVICQTDDGPPRTYSESESYAKSKSKSEAVAPAAQGGQATVLPPILCTDDFAAAWNDWLQHRREKKEPVKPGSQTERQQLRVLSEWGAQRAIIAIRFTIFKGWTGLREPDPRDVAKQNGGAVPWQRDSHNSNHDKF